MYNDSLVECPECREVATVTTSNFSAIIDCECGIIELDTMVEEDRLYPVYQQVFGTFAMGLYDDDPIKRNGSLKSIQHLKPFQRIGL